MSLLDKAKDFTWKTSNASLAGVPGHVKDSFKGGPDVPEAPLLDQANTDFRQGVIDNQSRTGAQIENSLNQGIMQTSPVVDTGAMDAKSKALGMTMPEDYSSALRNIGQNKYAETISDLKIQNKQRAAAMETKNLGNALKGQLNNNELKRAVALRRMDRQQARYAARMGAMSSVLKLGGTVVGAIYGGPAGAQVGGAVGGSVVGQPTKAKMEG